MLDMNEVGRKIAMRRREKNMTQMELADLMGVSFQAVSNWERGNSMPDIAKLPELGRLLDLTVDEMLADGDSVKLVRRLIEQPEEAPLMEEMPPIGTIADVAPLIKPRQVESLLEAVLEEHKETYTLHDIVALAPFIPAEMLGRLAQQAAGDADIGGLTALAPFLPKDMLGTLVEGLLSEETRLRDIAPLAPFLDTCALDSLALRAARDGELGDLCVLAPFLSEGALGELAMQMQGDGVSPKNLSALAPFLPKEVIGAIALAAVEQGAAGEIASIAPFLPKKVLKEIADKLMAASDMRALLSIAPFL